MICQVDAEVKKVEVKMVNNEIIEYLALEYEVGSSNLMNTNEKKVEDEKLIFMTQEIEEE